MYRWFKSCIVTARILVIWWCHCWFDAFVYSVKDTVYNIYIVEWWAQSKYYITVLEIRIRNWSAIFLKIGYFTGYWLLSHWKCTRNRADQNGFWSAKYWNWLENGRWPTVISNTVFTWLNAALNSNHNWLPPWCISKLRI